MTYRWFRWWNLLTLPLVASPFVVGGVLFVDAYSESFEQLLASVPVLVFSVILSYTSLAYLLNVTELTIQDHLLVVHHGPIPWPGRRFDLRECVEFRADKILDGRLTSEGVRVRMLHETFETVSYTKSHEEAVEWAEELNQQLRS